jgi:hypothetical protein
LEKNNGYLYARTLTPALTSVPSKDVVGFSRFEKLYTKTL